MSAGSAVMTHQTADVPKVEDPAESLGQGVGWVDSAGDMFEDNVASTHPFLNGVPLDVDVAGALSRLRCHSR
jgi:hypothetical protein